MDSEAFHELPEFGLGEFQWQATATEGSIGVDQQASDLRFC